jgi:galactonate dehydratase
LGVYPQVAGGLAWNSVLSATEMALTDIQARARGVPIHTFLGKPLRKTFPLYANVNRMTTSRTPEGFAASAKQRVSEGYRAVKLAPFDGVHWEDLGTLEGQRRLAHGIDCVLACRDAVGPDVKLMIDCHWRFDEKAACHVLKETERARLFWAECLVSERAEWHPVLQRVRKFAQDCGVLLAGAERQVGPWGFEPIAQGKLLDVVMPDIKYSGGYAAMLRIAARVAQSGIHFSPHNPTGPVCTLGSLHVCSLVPNFLILERQSEGSVYDRIIRGAHPAFRDGEYHLPEGPGLGIELDLDAVAEHPYKAPVKEALSDPRLG